RPGADARERGPRHRRERRGSALTASANAVTTPATGTDRALIVLEDGTVQTGRAYGARGTTVGEVVFNTGMTGYQETLTDPSYHRQVVVMTAPHIGNTGVNDEDPESGRIWVAGYVVRDPARTPSNWRSVRTLDDELSAQGVVGISGVDTRALTRHLRERGAMRAGRTRDAGRSAQGVVGIRGVDTRALTRHLRERGAMRAGIFSGEAAAAGEGTLLGRVRSAPAMTGADLCGEVATKEPYVVPA